MSFLPIGFAANLILNRLRNERHIADNNREDDEARRKQDEEEARVRVESRAAVVPPTLPGSFSSASCCT
jgi:hypothetical protein